MINYLAGTHGGMDDDGAICVMTHGVGYRVLVSDRDRELINKKGRDSSVDLFCATSATENEIIIIGFLSVDDRRTFARLRKLKGIGPATALRILSVYDTHAFATLVGNKDKAGLLKVPGIGKKTADLLLTVKL